MEGTTHGHMASVRVMVRFQVSWSLLVGHDVRSLGQITKRGKHRSESKEEGETMTLKLSGGYEGAGILYYIFYIFYNSQGIL
jgi:hypothetical protein